MKILTSNNQILKGANGRLASIVPFAATPTRHLFRVQMICFRHSFDVAVALSIKAYDGRSTACAGNTFELCFDVYGIHINTICKIQCLLNHLYS